MIRGVKIYGNSILGNKSEIVKKIDSAIRRLIEEMMETMYHYNGVGLAAPQIGESLRIVTMDPREPQFEARVLINPKIMSNNGKVMGEEGCLSLPNIYGQVDRAEQISITYTGIDGKEYKEIWKGFPARVAQHEIDHLNGILFIERLDNEQKEMLREQLKSLKKQHKEIEKIGPDIVDKTRGI
jgi:peptide deformylase